MVDRADPEDPLERPLRGLLDEGRAAEAVRERRRRSELHRQAAESGTFVGALLDLAEQGASVSITTGPDHRSRGRIVSLGADHVGLRGEGGLTVLVDLAHAALVLVEPGASLTIGDRVRRGSATLFDVLGSELGRPVLVRTRWDETLRGSLQALGVDVLTVRTDTGRFAYVSRAGITEVTLA